MPPVKMYIDKFEKEVIIDEDHPLALAQAEKNAAGAGQSDKAKEPDAAKAPKTPKAKDKE